MRVSDFNFFDWILILVVVISMVLAFRRGLVRAIFGLLGVVGGFQLAAWNYASLGDLIGESRLRITTPVARVLAFVVIVLVVAVLLEVAGSLVQKALRWVGLGPLDRVLGTIFGFARGCLVGMAVLMLTTTFAPNSEVLSTSVLTPYLFAVAHDVSFLVPQYLQQLMINGAYDIKHGTPHWIIQH